MPIIVMTGKGYNRPQKDIPCIPVKVSDAANWDLQLALKRRL